MKDDISRSTIRNVKFENPNVVLPFKTYTVKDGLIGNRIRALMQDAKGFMWIGTTDGLSIYDGSKFKNYSETNGSRIGSIVTIYESKFETGTVWVSQSSEEILRIKDEHITIYKCENTDKKNFAFCFYEDSKGVLWCGTRYGLYFLKGNKFSKVNTNLEFESVKNIYRHSDNSIILVSDFDCYLFDTKDYSIKLIPLNINGPYEYTFDSIMDKDGDIWIGIVDGSIIHLKSLKVNARYKMGKSYIIPCLDDNEGNIWASDVTGLIKFSKSDNVSRVVLYKPENGLPGLGFRVMLKDREGNIWFGSDSEGLVKLESQYFFQFLIKNPIQANTDMSYHIWIATRTELLEYWNDETNIWQNKNHKINSIGTNKEISGMKIDNDNNLILSFTNGEIQYYKIQSGKKGSDLEVLPRNYQMDDLVYSINPVSNNLLWIGQKRKIYSLPRSPTDDRITIDLPEHQVPHTVYLDRDNTLWFGTFENGLFKVNNPSTGSKIVIEELTEFRDVHPRSIYQTKSGLMLIGSSGHGLFKLKSDNFENINITGGLPSNTIWDISEGEDNVIWLATSNGMCYLTNENSNSVVINDITFGRWIFRCGVLQGGTLWGLDINGLVIYEYQKDMNRLMPPNIYIRQVSVNGEKIKFYDGMQFQPEQNNCDIEFIAPTFLGEQTIRYQFSISENDTDWSAPTENNRVTLAALKPGKYNFRVRAVKYNNLLSPRSATWSFTILPPIWQRWWFILLAMLAISYIVYLIAALRIKRVRQIERLRTQIASDLHDELASNLSSITMFGKIIEDHPAELPNLINRIINLSKESVNSIRDIIWTIDPQIESINDLLIRLYDTTINSCTVKGISLQFSPHLDHSLPERNLTPEQRKNIWMMLKEAVNNSIKHSNATSLLIKSTFIGGRLTIVVKDNGKGFDTSVDYKRSKGLETMRMRAKELGGTVTLNSALNIGTELIFNVKL